MGQLFGISRVTALIVMLLTPLATYSETLEWGALPKPPWPLTGGFLGVHEGTLIVAGGISQETGAPSDEVFVLKPGAAEWERAGALPSARAEGAAVSWPGGVLLIGGRAGERFFSDVLLAVYANDTVTFSLLPALPAPLAQHGAALVGDTVYVAGGLRGANAGDTERGVWALDLAKAEGGWRTIGAVPGPGRTHPCTAGRDGALYVIGGRLGEGGLIADGWRYSPDGGWRPIAAPPVPIASAAALPFGQAHLLVLGGVASGSANLGRPNAMAASDGMLAYHTITDTWAVKGTLPGTLAGASAVLWQNRIVLAGGQDGSGAAANAVLSGTFRASARRFGTVNSAVVIAYFAVLLGMGFYFARRERSTDDYFLGGRRVPWWAMGLSIFGTQLSAITFLSIPARAYSTDWVYVWANVGIVLIAPYVVFGVLPHFRRGRYTTAYEYLESRFNVAVRLYGALVFLLFQAGRLGIVLFLPALALQATTGLNVYVCILAMGLLATLYTVLGGIEAVIWTDVMQVLVLSAGVIIAFILITADLEGGAGELFATAAAADKFHMVNLTWDMTTTALWLCVIGNVFAVAYPYTADQTLVQRYLATATEKQAARAVWVNALLSIPATLIFFMVGTALFVFFKARPESLDPTLPNDAIFPLFIATEMPAGVAGLVIAAIFAAAMSSVDSSLNSIATVLVNDFYKRFRRGYSDAAGLRLARVLTCVFGALATGAAVLMAGRDVQSVFDQYLRILGLTGGGLAGVLALGMFTKRATSTGALLGAAISAATVYLVSTRTAVHPFAYGMIGFLTAFIVGLAGSSRGRRERSLVI